MFMSAQSERRRRMAALALARPESLEKALGLLPPLPAYTLPRRPEAGLIMAKARAGNTGQPFHVGEVLVTRCTVCMENPGAEPIMGYAWIRGRASRHAELAAVYDAFWQRPDFAPALDAVLWPVLARERQEQVSHDVAQVAPTRVEFFTLVRGEDEI
jgi:alpha-D-ribose 1-methylphosphonate 5-triphosphate synthase subunit PhnG